MNIHESSWGYLGQMSLTLLAPGREHSRILQTLSHEGPLQTALLAALVDMPTDRVQALCCDLAEQGRATFDGLQWRLGPPGCASNPCAVCPRRAAAAAVTEQRRRERMRRAEVEA